MNRILKLVTVCFSANLFLSVMSPSAHAQSVGQFRGTRAFTESISRRLYQGTNQFSVGPYLGIIVDPYGTDLTDLLGVYLDRGSNSQFINAEPNSANVMLWEVVAQGIARDFNNECLIPGTGTSILSLLGSLKPEVLAATRAACNWTDTAARSEAVLENLWLAVMSYDAPEAEYLAFRDFFMTAPQVDDASGSHLQSMVYAILMNPYFVLRR